MECRIPACHGEYQKEFVSRLFYKDGKPVVITNVPALVCDECGEEWLEHDTMQQIEQVLESGEQAGSVPLYEYAAATEKVAS